MNEAGGWTPPMQSLRIFPSELQTNLPIYLLDPERVCHETLLSSRNAEVGGRPNSGRC